MDPQRLSESQYNASTHSGRHILLLGGPGTGKTTTIQARRSFLEGCGIPGCAIATVIAMNNAFTSFCNELIKAVPGAFPVSKDNKDTTENVTLALEADPALCKKVGSIYEHLLIDDIQNATPLHYRLISALSSYCCVFMAGDEAQSIYSFLGVKHEYIRRIEELFQDITVIRLDTNYRSPQAIIDYANSILEKSRIHYDLVRKSSRIGGNPPEILLSRDEEESYGKIRNSIQESIRNGDGFKDTMVLCRTWYGLNTLMDYLKEHDIPFSTAYQGDTPYEYPDAVIICSIHSSKPLEAKHVHILECESWNWPNELSVKGGVENMEEERRVLYVALTRAKERVFLHRTLGLPPEMTHVRRSFFE